MFLAALALVYIGTEVSFVDSRAVALEGSAKDTSLHYYLYYRQALVCKHHYVGNVSGIISSNV